MTPRINSIPAGDQTVFELKHDADGEVRFVLAGDEVHVSGRWPFDLETGDFIHVGVRVRLVDYEAAIGSLRTSRSTRITGLEQGWVELTERGDQVTQLEIEDAAAYAPTRLMLRVPAGRGDLSTMLGDALNSAQLSNRS